MHTIGAIYGNLLHSCGSTETCEQKMFGRRSEGSAESGSVGSFRGSMWREQRQKRCKDREREHEEEQFGLGEGSYQMNRTVSDASGHRQLDERNKELERLRSKRFGVRGEGI